MKRLVTFLSLFIAANALAGVSYRFETTTNGMRNSSSSGRVIADGSKIRMEFEHGDQVVFKDSSVVVSTDGGKTMNVLDPPTKTFFTLKLDEILGSALAHSDLFKITFANPKVDVRALGDGGTIAGFPTKKSALDAAYDIVVEAMGQKIITHLDLHTEAWRTEKLPEEMTTFMQMKGFKTGNEGIDKLIEAASGPQSKGFPLKSVTTARTKSANGAETTVTTTTAIHDVKSATAAPEQFVVPAGYTKTESPVEKMLGAIRK